MNISPEAGGFLCKNNYEEHQEMACLWRHPIHVILSADFSGEEGGRGATHHGPDAGRGFSMKSPEAAPALAYIQALLRERLVSRDSCSEAGPRPGRRAGGKGTRHVPNTPELS